jgi:hypothetical protein
MYFGMYLMESRSALVAKPSIVDGANIWFHTFLYLLIFLHQIKTVTNGAPTSG